MTEGLVDEAVPADTEGVETDTAVEVEVTVPEVTVEGLVKDVETWLQASAVRTVLEPKDIRELQTLLIDVRHVLVHGLN
jgi:hypothetical protein